MVDFNYEFLQFELASQCSELGLFLWFFLFELFALLCEEDFCLHEYLLFFVEGCSFGVELFHFILVGGYVGLAFLCGLLGSLE